MEAVQIQTKAFEQAKWLERMYGDDIPWSAIQEGFELLGEKVLLATKAEGIFKPRQMQRGILSIKTTKPRPGRSNIYDDHEVTEGFFRYDLKKGAHDRGSNKHLLEAFEDQTPFIYFHAIAEGRYKAIWPCYVSNVHLDGMFCEVTLGDAAGVISSDSKIVIYPQLDAPVRAYAVRETRVRLHQATFRANVLKAYHHRCALTSLPIAELIEAAHITPDSESHSSTEISNGIAMSRIHHRAYDRHLLGISPDLKILISDRILDNKSSVLVDAFRKIEGLKITVPHQSAHQPDKDRIAARFEDYLSLN